MNGIAVSTNELRWDAPQASERTAGEDPGTSRRVLVSHDGRYRFWAEHNGSRNCIRWAQRNVPDHARGWFHGSAATLAEAVDDTNEHRELYPDDV